MTKAERLNKYKAARKNPKGPVKRLYSVPEAAFYLGRTVNALRQLIWAGKLPIVKELDGRRVLLDVKDLDAYIDRNKTSFSY
jgi:excisionase family DNA binding protein